MINIRHCCFETNSSSTHAICMQLNSPKQIPSELYFRTGEYGWQNDILFGPEDLGSYLYTAIVCLSGTTTKLLEWKNWITGVLLKNNCKCSFKEIKEDEFGYENCSINHDYELVDWLNNMRKDENRLINYLFGEDSLIILGNDNEETFDEEYDKIVEKDKKFKYEHEIYIKYN